MQPIVDSNIHAPRTPTALGFRRILNDADDQSHMDAKHAACHSFSLPHHPQYQQQQQQYQQYQYPYQQPQQQRSPVAGMPLRQCTQDVPRPQIHTRAAPFLPTQQPLLPPLAVSSISPPNSSRPVLGLAPLRAVGRQCRLLGCVHPAKLQGLCLEHTQQQQNQQQQQQLSASPVSPYYQQELQHQHQQIHAAASFSTHSPLHSADPASRPTLLPARSEFSITNLLSASPPRRCSPVADQHTQYQQHHSHQSQSHHHHPYSNNSSRRTPLLPALRTVGLPIDDRAVSPACSSAAPSPTSSTSSYSSYGYGSESATARTPPTSTLTTTRSAAAAKPATKCRREHCANAARRKGLCMEHGGRHFCKMDGCSKCAHRGGFCISHGGGRRCAVANCTKSAQSGGICYSHGGGKRCATDGCSHAARSGGFCIKHGKQQNQSSIGDEQLQ